MDPSPERIGDQPSGPVFFVGPDAHKCWIVREATGRCAGIFTNRETALRFARDEGEGRASRVVWMSEIKLFDDAPEAVSPDATRG